MTKRNALLSVYNKEGIVEFAQELVKLDFDLLASGGTCAVLRSAGLQVKDIAEVVGGGPILGHRVVTLSREIHAGLLAQDTETDRAELEQLGIPFIDLVCVDLYPLEEEIAKPDSTAQSVLEKTDVGGPTMLHAAAKGRRIVIGESKERDHVLDWLRWGEKNKDNMLLYLAYRAEHIVATYVASSARYTEKLWGSAIAKRT